MAKLDVDWLGVFIEIYKTRSVSEAADRLGMAQARASGVLAKLRRHFGDPLFARTSTGMEPTPYAAGLYPETVDCFERFSSPDSRRKAFDPVSARRRFRICMTDISEIVVLPPLINELRQLSNSIDIEAERITADSPSRLESGHADLAVGYMPSLEAGFYQQTLFMQDFVCLVARNHPRIREALNLKSFCNEGHVMVTTSGTGHAIVDREFAKRRIDRRIVLRVPSFLGIGRLVASTHLISIVPRRLGDSLAEQEKIKMFAPPIRLPTYAVKQHWHARFHADPGNVWLRNLIARVVAS